MSSTIIYKRVALRIHAAETGLDDDVLVLAALAGDSNSTERVIGRSGRYYERLSRDWQALAAGTHRQVMREVIELGADTYGGMIHVGRRGGTTTGSAFVAGTRRILNAASTSTVAIDGRPVCASFGLRDGNGRFTAFDGTLREYFALAEVREHMEQGRFRHFVRVYGPT